VLKAGQLAPDFELRDIHAVPHSLASLLRDGPVLLAFFKVSCPVCQMTLPFLERLSSAGQVRVVGISQDNTSSTLEFKSRFLLSFSTLLDEAASAYAVSNAFAITHVPSMFLVEKDNSIGWASDGFLKSDLDALGLRFGTAIFRSDEKVPAWKPG